MSYYENKRRWGLIGVQTQVVEKSLAPGFGRPPVCANAKTGSNGEVVLEEQEGFVVVQPEPQQRPSKPQAAVEPPEQSAETAKEMWKNMSNVWNKRRPHKRRTVPLEEVAPIDFQNATVEEVREWSKGIATTGASENIFFSFSIHTTPFEPDFKLTSLSKRRGTKKSVSFSACTKLPPMNQENSFRTDVDLLRVVLFGPGKKIDTLTMFPQLIDSCDVPIPLLPCLEENWEKLTLLLWAAYLAKNDLILVRNRPEDDRDNTGYKIVGRKLFLLHAALFELLPEDSIRASEKEYYDTWSKLLELAMKLSPRDEEGLTPLAIAALAQSPTTRPSMAKIVIDRILELDSTTAMKAVESSINGVKQQLPLHLVLQSGKNWDEGVSSIYDAFPDAADRADSIGRLPIHAAASCPVASGWAIHKILQFRPHVAKVRDRYGRLPLHHATDNNEKWSAGTESIFAAHPEAAFTPDFSGNLPTYYFPGGRVAPRFGEDECRKTSPGLLTLLLGDLSSKGVVHDQSKMLRKRPYDLLSRFTGLKHPDVRHTTGIDQDMRLPKVLNLTILPELIELLSNPLQQ